MSQCYVFIGASFVFSPVAAVEVVPDLLLLLLLFDCAVEQPAVTVAIIATVMIKDTAFTIFFFN